MSKINLDLLNTLPFACENRSTNKLGTVILKILLELTENEYQEIYEIGHFKVETNFSRLKLN